jgi:hypothetical protein
MCLVKLARKKEKKTYQGTDSVAVFVPPDGVCYASINQFISVNVDV